MIKKINFENLIELENEIDHPFSRKVIVSKIKKAYGEGYLIKYDFGNGLAIFIRNFTLNQDVLLTEESTTPGACFIFNIGTQLSFIYKDKKEYIIKKNHFFIELASNQFYCETPITKNEHYINYFIGVKDDLFLKLAYPINDIEAHMKKTFQASYSILTNLEIDTVQAELFNNYQHKNYFGDTLKSIYLESKTMDLLHYTIKKTAKFLKTSNALAYDSNRFTSLERAKEIILKEYYKNLSIKEISYRSAINECYLKKDFKKHYGITVYEMLQKRRLEVSKQLLQSNLSIKEVALKVGYKHAGNFSKIFQKRFGISASKFKKQFQVK